MVNTMVYYGIPWYIMEYHGILWNTMVHFHKGITTSADMKVSEQCGIAPSKGNQILGLIRRNVTYKEKS